MGSSYIAVSFHREVNISVTEKSIMCTDLVEVLKKILLKSDENLKIVWGNLKKIFVKIF